MEISKKDWNRILANPLFEGCNQELLRTILSEDAVEVAVFAPEEIILSPGEAQHLAGFLLEGSAEVSTPDPTRKALLRFLHPGDWFGIANLFSDKSYVSVIRAQKKCRVLFFPEEHIRTLLEEDRAFLYRYLGFLSGRVRYLNRKIGFLTAGGAERRLALYLVSFDTDCIRAEESLSALSELLDIGRASLYRAFARLEEDGYIRKEGKTLHILRREALARAYC